MGDGGKWVYKVLPLVLLGKLEAALNELVIDGWQIYNLTIHNYAEATVVAQRYEQDGGTQQ